MEPSKKLTEKEIQAIIKKREKAFEKLSRYQYAQNRYFNLRNYSVHINRVIKKIHMLNEILYIHLNIDKRKEAL
jgi:hypothetical protein